VEVEVEVVVVAVVAGQALCQFHQTIHPEVEAEAAGVVGGTEVEDLTHITREVRVKLVIKYTVAPEVMMAEMHNMDSMGVTGVLPGLTDGRPVDSMRDFLMSKAGHSSLKVYRFLKINGH
jgi:hypothetical protein